MGKDKFAHLQNILASIFSGGFEIYPFKIGWYNEIVRQPFEFDMDPDTIAFLIISTPDMFEKTLIPFLRQEKYDDALDPLDRCMKHIFQQAKSAFTDEDVEVIHDFEMLPSRRPKILVQPAGHASGAAFYYQRINLDPDPFDPNIRVCGVSVHPKYGGWFALRGVLIFKSFKYPDLQRKEPVNCVEDNASRIRLLDLFNNHWRDWRFRDIIQSDKKYSEDQKTFFDTPPKDRFDLIERMKQRLLSEGPKISESNGVS